MTDEGNTGIFEPLWRQKIRETIKVMLIKDVAQFVFAGFFIISCTTLTNSRRSYLPLHDATKNNEVVKIRELIDKGIDVNTKNIDGETPLHLASYRGDLEVSKILIKNGADVNARNMRGVSPLHSASQYANVEIIRLLLENGAEINAKNIEGVTPLFRASGRRSVEIVKELLRNEADPNISNVTGETPLTRALSKSRIETAKVLLKSGANVNSYVKYYGVNPLILASQLGNIDLVKKLIEKGADVNSKNKFGLTPVVLALTTGDKRNSYNTEIIRALIENGADISVINMNGKTPLAFVKSKLSKATNASELAHYKSLIMLLGKNSKEVREDLTQDEIIAKADLGRVKELGIPNSVTAKRPRQKRLHQLKSYKIGELTRGIFRKDWDITTMEKLGIGGLTGDRERITYLIGYYPSYSGALRGSMASLLVKMIKQYESGILEKGHSASYDSNALKIICELTFDNRNDLLIKSTCKDLVE